MKHSLLSILLDGGNGQVRADYKPTALDSATNGLYKIQPQATRRLGVE